MSVATREPTVVLRTLTRERAVHLEGGLFGPDLLERLASGELPGQHAKDFGLKGNRSVLEEAAELFRDARDLWRVFERRLERSPEDDPATSVTREGWVIPFLGLLGYELRFNPRAYDLGGVSYAVSHRAGDNDDAPPVHIVGARQELGRVDLRARPRMSPHALLQEFLNRSDHLWGLVTNGRVLRLLRTSSLLRRQAYLEFDLAAIFAAEGDAHFNDFVLLYRLLHRTRLPRSAADAHECWLEQYHQEAQEQGNRARERLREGVETCLCKLGTGLLRASDQLPHAATNAASDFYAGLLRLVYRFLFLLVAEERQLLRGSDLYREHYSISRLRRLVDRRDAYTDHFDLWHSLQVLWHLLRDPVPKVDGKPLASLLDLSVLDGGLFEPIAIFEREFANRLRITNRDLLEAFYHLVYYYDKEARSHRRVNYAALDVEELGSVYESLLDHHPEIAEGPNGLEFRFSKGLERKSTGSYYTPPELVQELIKSALEPVLEEKLRRAGGREAQRRALLSIRVLDPACGSGHFLLAAARRLGKELARIETGEDEPSPEAEREARREVIAHCIYGVDKNPLAVELCRVALWIESHTPGKPLTFLDHHIRVGDSLVGVRDLAVLKAGIPDAAFDPVAGDDKRLAQQFRRHNKAERQGQHSLLTEPLHGMDQFLQESIELARRIDALPDASVADVQQKAQVYRELRSHQEDLRRSCDLWTAAFFQDFILPKTVIITTDALHRALAGQPVHGQILGTAHALADRLRFFHWPLEFPEVFADGGFDVILCNPPWEIIELAEQEFFAARDPEIARAPNKAARSRLISQRKENNAALWQEYQQALHDADALRKFLRASGRFPYTARGRTNHYAVFSELFTQLLKPDGQAGVIVPTGIATDATNQEFFAHLMKSGRLMRLYDFENRAKLFSEVDSRYKFCLLTLRAPIDGKNPANTTRPSPADFAFFLTRPDQLRENGRRFTLTAEDLRLLNPNTHTCPIFRTRQDAELTKAIYRCVPVLVNEATGENPWGVRFLAMLDMANDSHLFRTRAELEPAGFRLVGNRFVKGDEVWLPLYEAKMIWHYDHRYGSHEGVDSRSNTQLRTPCEAQHADPAYVLQPWYWVPAEEVEARLRDWKRRWLLGWRDIARSTDKRTMVAGVVPRAGCGDTLLLLFPKADLSAALIACLLADQCSLVHDFVTRQKISGTHLKYYVKKQLPVLPPSAYTPADVRFIVPRVVELTYTAWDIKPFGDDVWREGDEALRAAIRRQWEESAAATGGHRFDPPPWAEVAEDGIPLPPFTWSEARRAVLRAELDAYYARLYGLSRKQLRYVLDPADLTERELTDILDPEEEVSDPLDPAGYSQRCEQSRFAGETFRVLKKNELRRFGEYRTRRLVLTAWEASCHEHL